MLMLSTVPSRVWERKACESFFSDISYLFDIIITWNVCKRIEINLEDCGGVIMTQPCSVYGPESLSLNSSQSQSRIKRNWLERNCAVFHSKWKFHPVLIPLLCLCTAFPKAALLVSLPPAASWFGDNWKAADWSWDPWKIKTDGKRLLMEVAKMDGPNFWAKICVWSSCKFT